MKWTKDIFIRMRSILWVWSKTRTTYIIHFELVISIENGKFCEKNYYWLACLDISSSTKCRCQEQHLNFVWIILIQKIVMMQYVNNIKWVQITFRKWSSVKLSVARNYIKCSNDSQQLTGIIYYFNYILIKIDQD